MHHSLQSGLSASGLPTKILYAILHCPAQFLLDFVPL